MAERVRAFGQTHSMELIFFPLIILILVGLISNAFASSAIQTAPILPTPTCTGTIEPGECYPTNVNGCDQNATANCQFTSATQFSFLSPNSPFTLLIEGNFNGFISAVIHPTQANLATNQPFTYFNNATPTDNLHPNDTGTTVFGVCGNINGTTWGGANGGLGGLNLKLQCNQNFVNSTQVPRTLGGVQYSKIFNNTPTHEYNCTSFNSATSGGSVALTKYVFYGCDIPGNQSIPTSAKYTIVAVNSTSEISAASGGNNTQLYSWILIAPATGGFHGTDDPNYCALVVGFGGSFISLHITPSFFCTAWGSAIHTTIGTGNQGLFGTFLVLGFVAGIVFLVMALGVTLNVEILTNGLGLGANDQGTKLMQAIGIGLLAWTFINSEFGAWQQALPFNLGTITFLTFTTMFFMGLYWRLFTLD